MKNVLKKGKKKVVLKIVTWNGKTSMLKKKKKMGKSLIATNDQ